MTSRSPSALAALVAMGAVWFALASPAHAAAPAAEATASLTVQIGTSVQGRPIEVACLGSGEHTVLVVGGMHTGPEAHSTELVTELARQAWTGGFDVPADTQLCLLPTLNPDGLASGARTNARGVDLNRNWPALNWSAAAYHPLSGAVSGGAEPLSEPETEALWTYILKTRPAAVLVLHCCGAVVEGNGGPQARELAEAYAAGAGMQAIDHWTAYAVTGQFIDAMDRIGITALDIEMAALEDIALDSNRAGLERVLAVVGETSAGSAVETVRTASRHVTYVVRPGDTLANIAHRHGTTADHLAVLNRLAHPDWIAVGQALTVPRA